MTAAEAKRLAADIKERWPHSEIIPARYIADLEMAHADHARAAVETLYRDGERFAPSGAQIIGRIADLALDAPPWGKVKAEIDRRRASDGARRWALTGRACPQQLCDGSGWLPEDEDTPRHELVAEACPCRDQIPVEVATVAGVHPLVTQFILEVGRAEIAALDGDRIAEAQVREKYDTFIRNVRRGVVYTGVDDAGLPGLKRLSLEAQTTTGRLEAGPAREIGSGGATS